MIIPAIDLADGQSVRLYQGDFNQKTLIANDPVAQAQAFEAAGATRLHLVDLDGAKTGQPINRETVHAIIAATTLAVEVGGGIRSAETAAEWLDAGVARVILGSVAITNPELVSTLIATYGPEKIVVGIDGKNEKVATDGWLAETEQTFTGVITAMAMRGVQTVIVTDTAKDGTLAGPNVGLLARLQTLFPNMTIIASGGVTTRDDLTTLAEHNITAAIVGQALASGPLTLADLRFKPEVCK